MRNLKSLCKTMAQTRIAQPHRRKRRPSLIESKSLLTKSTMQLFSDLLSGRDIAKNRTPPPRLTSTFFNKESEYKLRNAQLLFINATPLKLKLLQVRDWVHIELLFFKDFSKTAVQHQDHQILFNDLDTHSLVFGFNSLTSFLTALFLNQSLSHYFAPTTLQTLLSLRRQRRSGLQYWCAFCRKASIQDAHSQQSSSRPDIRLDILQQTSRKSHLPHQRR